MNDFENAELKRMLEENSTVEVVFTKADGSERTLVCCQSPDVVGVTSEHAETTHHRIPNPEVQPVWDIWNSGWRSFRWDSVKSFKELEHQYLMDI